jgi:ABC-2 type transport system permease protein
MSKIGLIIGREIKSKLSNKTFIIMTLLAPLLITGFLYFIIQMSKSDKTDQKVLVVDESQLFRDKLAGNDYISLTYSNESLQEAHSHFLQKGYSCLLWISPTLIEGGAGATKMY